MQSLVTSLLRVRGAGVVCGRGLGSAPLPASADYVIVGGGVAGASTAYHLASLGAGGSCLLLEADKLTSGTTWHSAAMLNSLRAGVTEAELVMVTKRLASEVLEAETGQSTGFKQHGGLTVTGSPERMIQFQKECDVARYTGNTGRLVTTAEAGALFPLLDTEGLQSIDQTEGHDANIFSLAILLSSFFVYNSEKATDCR